MRNLTLFILRNSITAKMKRGIRSFCSSVGSTSTLNQRKAEHDVSCMGSYMEESNIGASPLTLEQMLLKLDLEESAARRESLEGYRRMSCVNNSDILRSARNALSQHPRFSLDGRDSMYRSSFRNICPGAVGVEGGRRSVCCSGLKGCHCVDGYEVDVERSIELPSKVAGESVIWCKTGVVARLMGLDVVPVPIGGRHGKRRLSPKPKQNSRRMGRVEVERKVLGLGLGMHGCKGTAREGPDSCLAYDRCMVSPNWLKPRKRRQDW